MITRPDPASPVVVGRICGLHGVRGWVRVRSYTRPPERILDYAPWQVERSGRWQALTMAEGRVHGNSIIARLDAYADRDSAQALVGAELGVDRSVLPQAQAGEYYWFELIGLHVVNRDGNLLGTVSELIETGASDVLAVHGAEGEQLIPFVKDIYVLDVDLQVGKIVVDWEPGYSR